MNLRQLRIFVAVCEQESITRAAEKLYMTQPAVSHAIHELETQTGLRLFDRLSRRIYLTQAGKMLLERSVSLLHQYDTLEKELPGLDERAPLRVGSSITIANYQLPGIARRFRDAYPRTPLCVCIDNAAEIERKLIENEIDLGLIEGAVRHAQAVEKKPISSYTLQVFCSPEHPFAALGAVSVGQLAGQPLLLREKGSAIRDLFDSAMLLHNITVEPLWTSVNSQALVRGVRQNLGVSVLPDILLEDELESAAICRVSVPELHMASVNHLVFLKEKYLNAGILHFIKCIQI